MMDIDRRTLLGSSLAAGLCAALPATALAQAPLPRLFIFDARFAASALAAGQLASRGVTTLDPREHDLGAAWRTTIPALLERERGAIAGMTLWSDQFICQAFARDWGMRPARTRRVEQAARSAPGLQEWTLS